MLGGYLSYHSILLSAGLKFLKLLKNAKNAAFVPPVPQISCNDGLHSIA